MCYDTIVFTRDLSNILQVGNGDNTNKPLFNEARVNTMDLILVWDLDYQLKKISVVVQIV